MGIYDREYYRRDGPGFLESFTGQGKVCKWLIVLNVAFFVVQQSTPPSFTAALDLRTGVGLSLDEAQLRRLVPAFFRDLDRSDLSPEERARVVERLREEVRQNLPPSGPGVLQGQVWRLLTYAFLHVGIMHILFNMLFLWWFGHEMEELYGSKEFLIFYLTAAVLGGVAYVLWSWGRGNPAPCVGASGAVTAALVLYAFHYPTRVIYLWLVIPVPIWLFVGFQVAQDAFHFASDRPTDTAVTVHLAGAAFAFGYYKRGWRLAPLVDAVRRLRRPKARPRLRVYQEEEPTTPVRGPARPARPPQPVPEADEHLEAMVDAVLEKVARHGRDSLTESEKALLVRASEVYKRRRS